MQPINMQEVEEVVNKMVERKAPSPDDFTINFFHHWYLLKMEVLDPVEESRQKKWVLPTLNATHLNHIPK